MDTELVKQKYIYPNMHPAIKKLVDLCSTLNLNNIIEIGSGNGKIVKTLYQVLNNELNKNCKFTCFEGKQKHINEMIRNFKKNNPKITTPNMDVNAEFIKGFSKK